ncbi:phosphate/phosphite/phosphonate ABC transporter substrate-binding protein [Tellurirhabdus bombi]|uniref:phosphate/phosphite/phosphonate ABC transporter substrate-binding protein n=1 Tax=Tellurirhabdus bombi TaxID=2907205 RepID=UPI001F449EB9|nr:phosphate/phosphite/phosphonate ABC transporter substrate-binding protein [Tellurirhabdus bombi]
MRQVLTSFWLILLFHLVPLSSFAQLNKLRLATYTYADNDRLKNIKPLADVLSQQLGIPVETKSYQNVSAFIQGLQAGEVDIALISTFGYLLMTSCGLSSYTPVAALKTASGSGDNYKSAIIAHASLPINNLADLKEKASNYRMTFVSETSTSGNLIPRSFLYSAGITQPDEQFKEVSYSKTHAAGVAQVLKREADLAAFGSEEYYKAIQQNPQVKDQIKLLWLSEEIPLGPVLLKNSLPTDLQQRITSTFLALHETHNNALVALRSGWSEARQAEKFKPIDDAFYQSYRQHIGAPIALIQRFANLIR